MSRRGQERRSQEAERMECSKGFFRKYTLFPVLISSRIMPAPALTE
jgi:hypothetical protein